MMRRLYPALEIEKSKLSKGLLTGVLDTHADVWVIEEKTVNGDPYPRIQKIKAAVIDKWEEVFGDNANQKDQNKDDEDEEIENEKANQYKQAMFVQEIESKNQVKEGIKEMKIVLKAKKKEIDGLYDQTQ